MSTTLSNGYKLPQDGDLGDTYFDDLEFDIQRVNDHAHDGNDSERLVSTSSAAYSDTIASGSFIDQGDGYHRALVTVPVGSTVDDYGYIFKDPTSKEQMYLKMEKFNTTQYYVFINIAQNVEVYYLA